MPRLPAGRWQDKLKEARRGVLSEFKAGVVGIYLIGSISREPTRASDLDVVVVFRDSDYNRSIDDIRTRLGALAARINANQPQHELVLWASKEDHYRTLLPDVSYIRSNLPLTLDRLDAWSGLAKHTLIHYEAASGRALYGAFKIAPTTRRIPSWEAPELFVLSTRALGEGVVELASSDAAIQRSGINHLAKAGLRAAYSMLIFEDGAPRNSYADILAGAQPRLPEAERATLAQLYCAKVGDDPSPLEVAPVLRLMRHCELRIALAPRPTIRGIALGRAGESFGFNSDALLSRQAPIEGYSRFSGWTENSARAIYFTASSLELLRRLLRTGIVDTDVLDFFFEELAVCSTLAFFNPEGVRLVVGRQERQALHLEFGRQLLEQVAPALTALRLAYLDRQPEGESATPWLPLARRVNCLDLLLRELGSVPGLERLAATVETDRPRAKVRGLVEAAVWQCNALSGLFSIRLADYFGHLGLTLIQAGDLDAARAVLEPALRLDTLRAAAGSELQLDEAALRGFDSALSKAFQYHAITFHRSGDSAAARADYLRAMNLDPNNLSALDDLTVLLLADQADEDGSTELLLGLARRAADTAQAARGLAGRFMEHAIKLKSANDLHRAEAWYERAMKAEPTYAKPYYNLAILCQQTGRAEVSLDLYAKALALDPDYTQAYTNLGALLEARSLVTEAIAILSQADERGVADAQTFANLGNCRWRLGHLGAAHDAYERALRLDSDCVDALNGLAVVLLSERGEDMNALAEAEKLLSRVCELDPSFAGGRANYEMVRRKLAAGPFTVASLPPSASPSDETAAETLDQVDVVRLAASGRPISNYLGGEIDEALAVGNQCFLLCFLANIVSYADTAAANDLHASARGLGQNPGGVLNYEIKDITRLTAEVESKVYGAGEQIQDASQVIRGAARIVNALALGDCRSAVDIARRFAWPRTRRVLLAGIYGCCSQAADQELAKVILADLSGNTSAV